jgi:long-chain acyl-CoA synthetase
VLKEGESATPEEIISFCQKRLAPYKVPKVVEFRQQLPRSMVGKVLRRALLAQELTDGSPEGTKFLSENG